MAYDNLVLSSAFSRVERMREFIRSWRSRSHENQACQGSIGACWRGRCGRAEGPTLHQLERRFVLVGCLWREIRNKLVRSQRKPGKIYGEVVVLM